MKLKNKRMIRIISISVIAFLLVGSGILSFLQRKGKKEAMRRQSVLATEDESAYNQPDIPEITETAATTVSAADLVTPSDAVSQPVETQPTQPTEEKAVIKYVKTLKTTNIRKEDKATAGKITSVPTGSLMEYVSESSARYQVKYAGNQTGWVAKSCCEIVEKEVIIRHTARYVSGAPIDLKGTSEGDGLASILKIKGTMGASVAIIENGQVAYHFEYGYANKEDNKKVTENTKFRIASVSKVFTSMLAMKQTDEGILDLNKDISDILGFKVRNPSFKTPITTRMLLTHTSGLVDREKWYSQKINITLSDKNHYSSKPGTAFLYSNLGMGVAGAVVEKSANQYISEYARDKFFQPMGIDAAYDAKYLSDPKLVADCYAGNKIDASNRYLTRSQAVGAPGVTYHLGAGGLLISSEDLASVFTLLLNNGQYNGQQILSQKAVDEMLTKQCETKKSFEQCIGIRKFEKLVDNRDMYYHNGTAYGILSLMALDMNDKSGVVVITSGADSTRNDNTVFAVCDDVLHYCYSDILK